MTNFTQTGFGVTTSEHCTDGLSMLEAARGNFDIENRQLLLPHVTTKRIPVGIDDFISEDVTTYTESGILVPVRTDTDQQIGKGGVGEKFQTFQNREVVSLAETICQGHDFTFESMQVLGNGRGIAMQITCPDLNEGLDVAGDAHKGYLTIITQHDGSGSLRVIPTVLRMSCTNVLPAINRNAKGKANVYSIRHSSQMEQRIADMVTAHHDAMGDLQESIQHLKLLANRKVTEAEKLDLWTRVLLADGKDEKELEGKAKTMFENKLDTVKANALNPINVPQDEAAHETLYHALQPLTAMASRDIVTRETAGCQTTQAERRWASSHIGAGAKLADRAFTAALAMV